MQFARPLARGVAMIIVLAACLAGQPAWAHAILVESAPAADGAVKGPTVEISLRFNSRIDKMRSKLTLTAPDKTELKLPISAGGVADVVTTKADLAPGAYSLRWQVLAIDGHITRGDVAFRVTAP